MQVISKTKAKVRASKKQPKQIPTWCGNTNTKTKHVPLDTYSKPAMTTSDSSKSAETEELIDIQCRNALTRITSDSKRLKGAIVATLEKYHLRYSRQMGCIIAHLSQHQEDNKYFSQESVFDALVEKYPITLLDSCKNNTKKLTNRINGHIIPGKQIQLLLPKYEPMFKTIEDLVSYGRQCISFNLSQKFSELHELQSLPPKLLFTLDTLLHRYITSLLYEFIPRNYVCFLTSIYLEQEEYFGNEKFGLLVRMREKYARLCPYHQLFLLLISLTNYIAYKCCPINLKHFLELCNQAYAGIVQWPIVFGNRYIFQLPRTAE